MGNKKGLLITGLLIGLFVLTGGIAFAQEDVQKHQSCSYCGMERAAFAHSRMLIIYDDGTQVATCSVHCAATDLAMKLDKTPRSIHVGDYNTKKLIDAERAAWVIGGTRQGVMTKRAKWAFEKEPDARAFIAANGGSLATFDDVIKASYEDMHADTKMIREKRKMKKMQAPDAAGPKP